MRSGWALLSIFPVIIFLLIPACSQGQVKLSAIFTDNMVLQRDKPVFVWGYASPGEKVAVSFRHQKKSTTTDSLGHWQVILDKLETSNNPNELRISGSNNIILKNILVGDIWLCSGQSNMEYTFDRTIKKYVPPAKGPDVAMEELNKSKPDGIRYLYVERTLNKIPLLPTKGWINGSDSLIRYVSSIGYFFAKEVYEKTKVPIGIISSSWGGTRIEPWTPEWAYQQSTIFKDSTKKPKFTIDGARPAQIYRGMIEPILPFTIKGVLWYQGESNCMIEDEATYPEKFALLVSSWRQLFKDDHLPFYTVQVAPYLYSSRKDNLKHTEDLLPKFWEAQTLCTKIPGVEMVVTTDLVDKLSEIHPSYKWIVAHRLAISALAKSYHQSIIFSGPTYISMKPSENKIILSFSNTGCGLTSNDTNPLTWFTIAGQDGNFVAASAVIKGNRVEVSSPGVHKPLYVRFAWNERAQPNLINKEGLPAIPFRTDNLIIY